MSGFGVLLAIAASLMYGASNVLSGAAVQRHATASLALWAQTTGLLLVGVLTAVRQPRLVPVGLVWGVSAGAVGALAVLAFYTALQRGRTSVVASVSGAGVVAPVVSGFVSGEPVGWRAGLGVAAAIAGVLVVAAASGEGRHDGRRAGGPAPVPAHPSCGTPGRRQSVPAYDACVPRRSSEQSRSAVGLAVLSAAGFGSFFIVLKSATTRADPRLDAFDSALTVSLAVQVGALLVTLAAATRHTRACIRPHRTILGPATAIGLLDVTGDLVLTVAVGHGPLSVIGPLGSLAPVVAVVLATAVLHERLRPWQLLGVLIALGGIVLIVTG